MRREICFCISSAWHRPARRGGQAGNLLLLEFCVAQARLPQEVSACTPLCGAGFSLRAFAFLRRGGVYPARRRSAPALRFLECGACLPLTSYAPRRELVIPSRDAARDLLYAFGNSRLVPSSFETFCPDESYAYFSGCLSSRGHRIA